MPTRRATRGRPSTRALLRGAALATLLATLLAPGLAADPVLEGIAYDGEGGPTLDLYQPREAARPAPLLVFVDSRFWGDSDSAHARTLTQWLARPLQRHGAAVAIVRHRPGASHPHPAPAQDVADALAYLVARSEAYGFDREHVVLAGLGSGAHLAALVGLDPRYLAAHDLTPELLRGVVAISGRYDLDPPAGALAPEEEAVIARVFGDAATRREASPVQHLRADAPLFLMLAAQNDSPGAQRDALAFAEALRSAGHPLAEALLIGGRDHFTQLDLRDETNPVGAHLEAVLGIDVSGGTIEEVFATRRRWRDPPFDVEGFWDPKLSGEVLTFDADERFLQTLNMPFAKPGQPRMLNPRQYRALDLFGFLKRRAQQVGADGDWLVVTNARGEQGVWRLSELRELEPVIVIGLDDQRNLFRLADFYHTLRRYSWLEPRPQMWVLARPLGSFLHFRKPPPPGLDPGLFVRFGLEPKSFARVADDPLAPLRDLPEPVRTLVLEDLRCVACHQLRGVGGRAGHLRATDAELVGGFGRPIESYPPEVWHRYCFEQVDLAADIGASPVAMTPQQARALFEFVEAERAAAR